MDNILINIDDSFDNEEITHRFEKYTNHDTIPSPRPPEGCFDMDLNWDDDYEENQLSN